MDTLINKQYAKYDYRSRYTTAPYFYDTLTDKYVYGLGTNMRKDTGWVAHDIKYNDTLDYLALKYYNNPTLWWVIAYFNDIQDPFIKLSDWYTAIKIPSISSIQFGNER